jgi:PAS domain S-box-containing protein
MGQAKSVDSRDPFGTILPPDVLGAAVDRFNDIVMVTEATPSSEAGFRILFVNPAFEKITGYRPDEVLGRSSRFTHGPGTSVEEVRRIEAAVRAHKAARAELLN